jgi:hypothetical protein
LRSNQKFLAYLSATNRFWIGNCSSILRGDAVWNVLVRGFQGETIMASKPNFKKLIALSTCAGLIAIAAWGATAAFQPSRIQASDHDDGDIDVRSRALSLTDLYVFRERDQNSSVNSDDLILVMSSGSRESVTKILYPRVAPM